MNEMNYLDLIKTIDYHPWRIVHDFPDHNCSAEHPVEVRRKRRGSGGRATVKETKEQARGMPPTIMHYKSNVIRVEE